MFYHRVLNMRKLFIIILLVAQALASTAQETLSLERCRQLALDNNKQLQASKISREVAENTRKAARTKYLPHVDGLAGYQYFSREISLLNGEQKSALSNLGTNAAGTVGSQLNGIVGGMVEQGLITPDMAQKFGSLLGQIGGPLAQAGNDIGNTLRDALKTDTKHVMSASIMVTQPVYMGGAIKAANEMARIGESMADNNIDNTRVNTLYAIDNAYWLAVSLKNKQRLATEYLSLVKKLNADVHKMIDEGVATRADGLKVDVAVNDAEMQLTQVDNGVSLAKMLLCQLCGLPLNGDVRLADEEKETIDNSDIMSDAITDTLFSRRPETRLLQNAVDMSLQTEKLVRAAYLPHVALTGGFLTSNPSVFNSFERKFRGMWTVGFVVQVPIWSWNEGKYKINAARSATRIAQLQLDDVREKMALQVEQNRFKVSEAQKRLATATKNMASAEENLRCANVGFREGVMTVTDVMAAQTAWQQAKTHKTDAEIELKLADISLRKALGE